MFPHHINQLGDLESKADFNGVVGVLDRPDPALVPLEKAPEQGVLHLRQGDKLTLTWNEQREHGSRIKYSKALIFPLTAWLLDWVVYQLGGLIKALIIVFFLIVAIYNKLKISVPKHKILTFTSLD